jgi:hypothetical protein
MKAEVKTVLCRNCGAGYAKDDLEKQCSNCFACTGCEQYQCPSCKMEIVIRPIGQPRRRQSDKPATE